ncbi:hypothetical protein [Streptomyces sp. NPDC051567]|uniref:hypothetical protein n=1 Tax=Streptomyces sp. NPDC051567 TaxID=3365660 RepID=UPI0037A47693
MAVEYGPGVFGPGFGAGLADAVLRQAKALEVEFESLTGYKKLVDDLLKKLDGSEADQTKLAHGTLAATDLGTGFAEADALFTAYSTVHTQLQNLSKGLAGQIEALGIAIMTAGRGFNGVDEDVQRRMQFIAAQAMKDYVPDRDPLTAGKNEVSPNRSSGDADASGGKF